MDRTYGQIKLLDAGVKPTWLVRCEPHVVTRLIRLFPRSGQGREGIQLLATDEICRDLQWFLIRYPMQISSEDQAYLNNAAARHEDRLSLVAAMSQTQYIPPEFQLAVPLRLYQRIAVELALQMRGLLIADDVGTGKTACAIGAMTCKEALPALVVTLPHLCRQWQREINRFAPSLVTHVIKKGTPYDLTVFRGKPVPFPDVLILNYHKLAGWSATLAPLVHSVMYDECQELRHDGSQKYNAAKRISTSAAYRIGLSATPIFNYGSEFYSVIECLRPDSLGSYGEFLREWCQVGFRSARIKDPKAFGSYLREHGIMIRRTRLDVGRELPAHQTIPHYIDADLGEIEKVSANVAELAKIILQQGGTGFSKLRAAEELDWKLRQATGLAKAPFAAEFVKLLLESEQKVVVFAWHREVYSILRDRLRDYSPLLYTGSESPAQKDAAVKEFILGRCRVLLVSLRAGAGLDGLQTVCRTTVHAELDWSHGVHVQNTGRVARDGQTQPVTSYFLIAEAGSDPIVADVLGIKHRQLEPVLNPDEALIKKLDVRTDHIKQLAAAVLQRHGIPMTDRTPVLLSAEEREIACAPTVQQKTHVLLPLPSNSNE